MDRISRHDHFLDEARKETTRRWFFKECGVGLGAVALGQLLSEHAAKGAGALADDPLAPKIPHFAPKAKRVIYLFMAGGPSHLELFDNKPELAKFNGKLPPAELLKGYRAAFINPNSTLLRPEVQVRQARQVGPGDLRAAPPPGGRGRRRGDRQVDAHRRI